MPSPLRWGILGTGNIARQFCAACATSTRTTLAAVGSRSLETARKFAAEFAIPITHGNYASLLADPGIDAIYLSLPNSLHHQWTIKALSAGKHVLCEKPLGMNAHEAVEMFDAARRSKRTLMEAFMYRTQPLILAARQAVRDGAIGELRIIRTSFCYRTSRVDANIRFDPSLGGGALMDVGCYCIHFSRFFAGAEPTAVHAVGRLHATGVDEMVSATLAFPRGILATFTAGMTVQADNTAMLCGSEGFMEIPIPWKPPRTSQFTIRRGTPPRMDLRPQAPTPPHETRTIDAGNALYAVEADDFAASILDNHPPTISRQDSLGNMHVIDEIRRQIGSAS